MDKVLKALDDRLSKVTAEFVELVSVLREDVHISCQNIMASEAARASNRKLMLVNANENKNELCVKCSNGNG